MKLTRIDPHKNMHRFYEVHVQSTLLDSHAVVCTWGSVKNLYQRVRIIKTESQEEAEKLEGEITGRKKKQGYVSTCMLFDNARKHN